VAPQVNAYAKLEYIVVNANESSNEIFMAYGTPKGHNDGK